MDAVILSEIPMKLERADVFRKIHMDPSDAEAGTVDGLIESAHAVGAPKALYKPGYIDSRNDQSILIDGIVFQSRILRVNTAQAHQVFAYLATCGTELEAWARSLDDMLEQYWADAIMELALRQALRFLSDRIGQIVRIDKTSAMNPGSLADWPIQQQRPLFDLIGPASSAINIRLTDSFLMTPAKSVSGIRFATEVHFENCQLCPRSDCSGRRVPFNKDLHAQLLPVAPRKE